MIEWRIVEGSNEQYEVSNTGRVRDCTHKQGLRQYPSNSRNGKPRYFQVYEPEFAPHGILVHVLVARAFIGPRPKGHVINHINHDGFDNRAENLEYITNAENIRLPYKLGLKKMRSGESIQSSRVTDKQRARVIELYRSGKLTRPDVARVLNLPLGSVLYTLKTYCVGLRKKGAKSDYAAISSNAADRAARAEL